jgi:hypothetical protein
MMALLLSQFSLGIPNCTEDDDGRTHDVEPNECLLTIYRYRSTFILANHTAI